MGIRANLELDNDVTIKLYSDGNNPGGTTLATISVDKDQTRTAGGDSVSTWLFASPQSLSKDTNYRVAIDRNAASVGVAYFDVSAAGELAAAPGGANFIRTHGSSSWTDVTTSCPFIQLLIDQFDDGTGGGGGGTPYIIGG